LADLDQVTVGVADVGADLASVVLWLGEKLRAPCRPLPVDLVDVGDTDVEEGAGAVGIGGRGEGDGWLVVGGPPPSFRISQELATLMMTGSRSTTTLPSNSR
jgi:hypothetical protein